MNLNLVWARTLFTELIQAGVREAVICPGSRSAPLAIVAAEMLRSCTVLDERCAAFFALGAAKISGRPVVVLCTSGSAGAHFLPAILEAEATGVPLIALTADRPPELHGFGAPQTLDQQRLFGAHARFLELGSPDPRLLRHLRASVAQAASLPGPLHLNAPFREPLVPSPRKPGAPGAVAASAFESPFIAAQAVDEEAPAPVAAARTGRVESRSGSALHLRARGLPDLDPVYRALAKQPRGLIFCGPRDAHDGLALAARALADALGYALLADAGSQVRTDGAVTHADLILRSEPWARGLRPGAVIRLGGGTSSKLLQSFLEQASYTLVIREQGEAIDPSLRASAIVEADAVEVCRALAAAAKESRAATATLKATAHDSHVAAAPDSLAALFAEAERRARGGLESGLAEAVFCEPQIARAASRSSELLYCSSSMPIRDLDAFGGVPRGRVLCNRGLNGIDGIASSAAGAAWSSGVATTVLLGDLALLHDLGGLVAAARLHIPLRVLCINNDGGGIFHFLPIAQHPAVFEPLFGTPHGMNFEGAALLCGAAFSRVDSLPALEAALAAPRTLQLIEARTDREQNVAQHRALQAAVVAAMGAPR